MTTPTPLYRLTPANGVYRLQYSWTGWPFNKGDFGETPTHLIARTSPLWKKDGLTVLEYRWLPEHVQILFQATPGVAPTFVAARAKGRLDHALRTAGIDMWLSRKTSIRALGDNTRHDVEAYVEHQVDKERFVDPQFEDGLTDLQVVNNEVDLAKPVFSAHGKYWYNLHVVFVTEQRIRLRELQQLRTIRDATLKIAAKKRHAVSRLAVMPDHLHVALRPQIEESPLQVAFAYLNNLGHMVGRLWQEGYYVGSFGEYSANVVGHTGEMRT
jgi:REP element-mobilizing transposase RayT